MSDIFISYRRDDTEGHSGRLYDQLSSYFGDALVFFDVNSIPPGEDFVNAIQNEVGACSFFIAVIGRDWLTVTDATGQRRLDNPRDFVRLEIAAALKRDIRVIPVLVNGATMPTEDDLPVDIKALARRNAHEVDHRNFRRDAETLIALIEKELGSKTISRVKPAIPMPQIRQPISDKQRNDFLYDSFEIIRAYFQAALSELGANNEWIETTFRNVTEAKFTCQVYVNGRSVNQCKIWLGRGIAVEETIGYVEGRFDTSSDTSWNEMISVRDDGKNLYLQAAMIATVYLRGYQPKEKASAEDIAELLWRRFTQSLDNQ